MATQHRGAVSDNRYYVNLRQQRSMADATTARRRVQGGSALYRRGRKAASDASRNFSAVSRFDGVPLASLTVEELDEVFEDIEREGGF